MLLATEPPLRLPTNAVLRGELSRALVQNIYLEPLDTAVLFAAPTPIGFETSQNPSMSASVIDLEGRGAGEVYAVEQRIDAAGHSFNVDRKSGLRYTVYSDTHPRDERLLAQASDLNPATMPPELAPYLSVPKDLAPRIVELAQQVTSHAHGPFMKALALEEHLRTSYQYTLDLKRDERFEPLDDFLFVEKAGHCEYFASAMAIMLRAVGVPSRSVNGFLGGEWNSFGNYLAMRQGDAHNWVEAWIDGYGWVTFDPTPLGPPAANDTGLVHRLRQMMDTVELSWFKYVIEYDLAKQVDIVASAQRWTHDLFDESPSSTSRPSKKVLISAAAFALALLGAFGLKRLRKRTPRALRFRDRVAMATYTRALDALERRGFVRAPHETGRALSLRVAEAGDPASAAFSELVDRYYAVRYGEARIPAAELARLADQVCRPEAHRRAA